MIAATFDQPRLDDTEQRLLYKLASTIDRLPVGGGGSGQTGTGSPVGVATPAFVDQLYIDTTGPNYWRSTGLTSADWTAIAGGSGGGLVWGPSPTTIDSLDFSSIGAAETQVSFPTLTDVTSFVSCLNNTTIISASFPALINCSGDVAFAGCSALTTVDLSNLVSIAGLDVDTSSSLVSLLVPKLKTIGSDNFYFNNNTALVTLDLSSLVTCSGSFVGHGCTLLVNFNVTNWIPTDGTSIDVQQCALSAASVEQVLRRCVLAGVTTCAINVSGGTNAGLASLSAQGQTDAATLGAQLTINP